MDDIEVFKQIFPEKYFYEFWLKDKRPDNRQFTQIRKTTISRSGAAGFILSSGTNVIQTTYEIQNAKVKINTDAKSRFDHLYDKISVQFEQEDIQPLYASYIDHLKRICIKKYENQLSVLKINERILIDISALFYDTSLMNSVLLSIVIALYDCFVNKQKLPIEEIDLILPVVLRSFYIPEKDALLWLWDPSKEELALHTLTSKPATYISISSLTESKTSLEKIDGTDMSLDDLANLTQLFKDSLDRSQITNSISTYLGDMTLPEYRII